MRSRLAAVMFLEYAVQGLWSVPLAAFLMGSPHEGGLNMPAGPVALIYATMAVGATLTPLLVGLLCDRLFAVQWVLAVLHFVGSGLLAAMLLTSLDGRQAVAEIFRRKAELEMVIVERPDLDYESAQFQKKGWSRKSGPLTDLLDAVHRLEERSDANAWKSYANHYLQGFLKARVFDAPEPDVRRDVKRWYEELLRQIRPAIAKIRTDPEVLAAAERTFPPLFALMLAYACVYIPTISLSNVVAFRNLPDPGRQYGPFRALGTLGWIAAGLFVGFAAPAVSPLCFLYAAVASAVLAALCLLLPNTPPASLRVKPGGSRVAAALGLPALKMLGDRPFLVYVLAAFVATALMPFHNVYTNKFLVDLHIDHPAAVQTLAQPTEILGALAIPWLWWRLGTKWMLTLGLLASAARFFLYATESTPAVIGLGLPLHGIGFALFYIAAALYVDREAPSDLRASAQGLVTVITLGVGGVIGTWFAGQMVEYHTAGGAVAWRPVWLVPAAGTLAAAVAFAAFFREQYIIHHGGTENTEKK